MDIKYCDNCCNKSKIALIQLKCNCGESIYLCFKCDDDCIMTNLNHVKRQYDQFKTLSLKFSRVVYSTGILVEEFGLEDSIQLVYNLGVIVHGNFICDRCIKSDDIFCPICKRMNTNECISEHKLYVYN